MELPIDPILSSGPVDTGAESNAPSNKRPLADDSFSAPDAGAVDEATLNGTSNRVPGAGDDDDDMSTSLHFGGRSTGMGKTLSANSTGSQQSFLQPASGYSSEAPRKRLRRGPESSPQSHITSPADSDHSSAPNLTSPAEEDAQSNLATTNLRNHLSQFKVDSGPPSSSSSAYGGVSMGVSPAPEMSRNGSANGHGDIVGGASHDTDSSSPPVQLNRMRRGKPPQVQESPSQGPIQTIDLRSPGTPVASTGQVGAVPSFPSVLASPSFAANPPFATGPSVLASPSVPSVLAGRPYVPAAGPSVPPPGSSSHQAIAPSPVLIPTPGSSSPHHPLPPPAVNIPDSAPDPETGMVPEFDRFYTQVGTAFPRQRAWVEWNRAGRDTVAALQRLVVPAHLARVAYVPPPASGRRQPNVISRPIAPQPIHRPGGFSPHQQPGHFYGGSPQAYPPLPPPPPVQKPVIIQNSSDGGLVYLPPGFVFPTDLPREVIQQRVTMAAEQYRHTPDGRSYIAWHMQSIQAQQRASPLASGSRPPASQNRLPPQPQSLLQRNIAIAAATARVHKKKARRNMSDSDDDGNDYSEGSGDEYGGPSPAVIARREAAALIFFNECSKEELQELAGCNPAQSTLVFKLRPFESTEDFRSRTRKQKGVGNNMLDNYLEVVQGMAEVDKVLTDCEEIGKELAAIMKIWASGTSADPISRPGTPDVGLNLTKIAEESILTSAETSQDPAVRLAFKDFLKKQPDVVPSNIVLKDYQMLGLNWLNLLYRRKTSCILADEMGLGKTAQVIALMAHLKASGEQGPHLVIVPSSTLENWLREFAVFGPTLKVESYYGSQAERQEIRHELKHMEGLDVIVTTYNIAASSPDDQKFLRKRMDFKICIFDEGHQLKNSESKKYKDLMMIRAKWRCLLTGTPLQNNLQELVSLLSFILPDQFRDAGESLRAIFKVAPGSQANLLSRERISRAKKMMTPFVLRRKKAQVLKDLPNKSERIEWCDMTDLQQEVYNEAITRSKKALLEMAEEELEEVAEAEEGADDGLDPKPAKKAAPAVPSSTKTGNVADTTSSSNVLMDLRKASCHPMLFRRLYPDKTLKLMARDCLKELDFTDRNKDLIFEDFQVMTDFELHRFCLPYKYLKKYALQKNEWMSAGKIQKLQELLPKLKANGDRVLLFSQFTQVLDILEVVLATMNIRYLKLTGQTNVTERQGLVDEFTNDPDITVFLLSTRAGGLGLNLVAANTVCFYDQDYNPHNDKQAEDRAFRIGQVRDVTVIKLITRGTLEEDMRDLASQKLLLDDSVSSTSQYPSGVQPTSEGDEGNSAQVAKKMRTSLLSNLKRKFTASESKTGEAGPSPKKEDLDAVKEEGGAAEMEVDAESTSPSKASPAKRGKKKAAAVEEPKEEVEEEEEKADAEPEPASTPAKRGRRAAAVAAEATFASVESEEPSATRSSRRSSRRG